MTPINFATVLKWVGYATAILSLIAGVRGLTKVYSDRAETRRKVEALLASEQIQAQGHDYRSAWQTLEQAAQADPNAAAVRDAQETLNESVCRKVIGRAYDQFLPLIRAAKARGCRFTISTDAHRTAHLMNMRFGVVTARRGWLEAADILNTRALAEFKAAL